MLPWGTSHRSFQPASICPNGLCFRLPYIPFIRLLKTLFFFLFSIELVILAFLFTLFTQNVFRFFFFISLSYVSCLPKNALGFSIVTDQCCVIISCDYILCTSCDYIMRICDCRPMHLSEHYTLLCKYMSITAIKCALTRELCCTWDN